MPSEKLYGLDELTMRDLAIDGGRVDYDDARRRATIVLGPMTSLYASHETPLGRAMFRGLVEGFGFMSERRSEDAHADQ